MPSAVPRVYKSGENFDLYIKHFNRVATANEWEDDALKIAHLESKLTGKALRQFEVFIEEEPDITFADLTAKLIKELLPPTQKSIDVFSQMRLDDRSPKEFYAALIKQSKLAHGDIAAEVRNTIVKSQFLQALPATLKKEAAKQNSLADMEKDDLLELLTRIFEAEMKQDDEEYEPTIASVQTFEQRLAKLEQRDAERTADMTDMMKMIKEMHGRLGNENPSNSRNRSSTPSMRRTYGNVTCFRCLKEGHMVRECPNAVVCSGCKKEGHIRARCPKN